MGSDKEQSVFPIYDGEKRDDTFLEPVEPVSAQLAGGAAGATDGAAVPSGDCA